MLKHLQVWLNLAHFFHIWNISKITNRKKSLELNFLLIFKLDLIEAAEYDTYS